MDVTQKKCVIRWQSQGEEDKSLELDVVRENTIDPFEVMINDLEEGQYEFSITTYDAKGNSSIESVIEGYAYGDFYEGNLVNRKMDRLYTDGNDIVISWRPANNALKCEMYYTDVTGKEKTIKIPIAETETRIEDCDQTKFYAGGLSICRKKMLLTISILILQKQQSPKDTISGKGRKIDFRITTKK